MFAFKLLSFFDFIRGGNEFEILIDFLKYLNFKCTS